MHDQKQSSLLPEEAPKYMLTQKTTIKSQANSLAETRWATVCVTRRMHIKTQANSQTVTRQTTVCVTTKVHIKN